MLGGWDVVSCARAWKRSGSVSRIGEKTVW